MRRLCASHRISIAFALALAWCSAPTVWAQAPVGQAELVPANQLVDSPEEVALIEEGRSSNAARQCIEVITSHFPRRLTGGLQLKLAQDWIVDSFEGYKAEARLEQWGSIEVGFDRGVASGKIVGDPDVPLTFVTPAWSPKTYGPLQGPALVELEDMDEMRARIEEFKGAWVLRHPAVSRREGSQRVALLEEHGAAGYIQPGARDGRLVTGGNRAITWDNLPTLPRVTLLYEEFEALIGTLNEGTAVELEFDIRNQYLHGPIPQYNVVVDIKGTEWPDEYVIVQGHVDAWDNAQGACDNGTGVATTMSAAHMLLANGIRPRRTIRFVFYSGEEQGLLGSRGYVEMHVGELEHISIVLNHDNGTRYLAGIQATEAMMEDFGQVFQPIMGLDPERPFEIKEVDSLRGGSSDHAPFLRAGVPAFHWKQSHEGYRRLHHTQYDTLEEVDHDDQRHSTLVVALTALRFANLDHLVDRSFMREPAPRRMGVFLGGEEGTSVDRLSSGGKAALAKWEEADRIVSVDGVPVNSRSELVAAVKGGGAVKLFVLRRGDKDVESTLDWSDDPEEEQRRIWLEHLRVREAQRAEGEAAKGEKESCRLVHPKGGIPRDGPARN